MRTCLLLIAFALAACRRAPEETPESVLTAWVNAMNASRSDIEARRRAYELLSDAARASLADRAARASQLSGRDLQPWEMLAPGRFAMRFAFDPEGLRTRVEGDHATVTARGPQGDRASVPMVRENGHWHVDLALPSMQTIQSTADGGAL
jgi:hypothetical protein